MLRVDGRVCSFEFTWLVTGALCVRFFPYNALTGRRVISFVVYAFSSVDAAFLAVMARDDKPGADLLNARFNSMLLLRPWYSLTFLDVTLQTPCIFCTSRGQVQCACPTPMKRRRADDVPTVTGILSSEDKPLWSDYTKAFLDVRLTQSGTGIFNMMELHTDDRNVPASSMMPYRCDVRRLCTTHRVLQQFLAFAGASVAHPMRMQLLALTQSAQHATVNGVSEQLSGSSLTKSGNTEPEGVEHTSSVVEANGVACAASAGMVQVWPEEARGSIGSGSGDSSSGDSGGPPCNGFVNGYTWDVRHTQVRRLIEPVIEDDVRPLAKTRIIKHDPGEQAGVKANGNATANGTANGNPTPNTNNTSTQPKNVFTCPICGLQVRNKKSNLTRHIAIKHEKARNFVCDVRTCERRFQSKHNLERHRRSVHAPQSNGETV